MRVAFAALALLDIVFEVGIARCRFGDFGNCLRGERGAAEIGVQNDSGRVDYRAKRRRECRFDGAGNARGDRADANQAARRVAFQLRAQFFEHIARRMGGDFTSRLLNQTGDGGLFEEFVNRRQRAQTRSKTLGNARCGFGRRAHREPFEHRSHGAANTRLSLCDKPANGPVDAAMRRSVG